MGALGEAHGRWGSEGESCVLRLLYVVPAATFLDANHG
jgi:hypothetical protein